MLAFVFSGFCAGLAALLFSSRLGSVEPAQAAGFELSAIAIAVIGGVTLRAAEELCSTRCCPACSSPSSSTSSPCGAWSSGTRRSSSGLIIIAAGFVYTVKDRGGECSLNSPS